ncbi:hypothetical protein BD309DRAFT_694845 [Dichomitus squalens]|nr:hypothetical protein BD309DRAFT_694845 [Dichomitus squalens]
MTTGCILARSFTSPAHLPLPAQLAPPRPAFPLLFTPALAWLFLDTTSACLYKPVPLSVHPECKPPPTSSSGGGSVRFSCSIPHTMWTAKRSETNRPRALHTKVRYHLLRMESTQCALHVSAGAESTG